jgi:hypothetical protein
LAESIFDKLWHPKADEVVAHHNAKVHQAQQPYLWAFERIGQSMVEMTATALDSLIFWVLRCFQWN